MTIEAATCYQPAVSRVVSRRYDDPLSIVWLGAAARIGLHVVRTPDAYAATDGCGTLAIGEAAQLDADDSVAQMVLHELCHSLIEGPDSFGRPDWGMDNTGPDHDWREYACLRLQWTLTGRYGLRGLFAPTTDFRQFWDELAGGSDPLADRADVSVRAAIIGLRRAQTKPWAPALADALQQTATIASATAQSTAAQTSSSLWSTITAQPALHPTGLPAQAAALAQNTLPTASAAPSCGSCAWRYISRGKARCRQAEGATADGHGNNSDSADDKKAAGSTVRFRAAIVDTWPACERYEAAITCLPCGACCREAYHSVEVSRNDSFRTFHPDLVVDHGTYREVRRVPTYAINPPRAGHPPATRCVSLAGGELVQLGKSPRLTDYHCTTYDARPRTCREFTLGSDHCLQARQRVGLSL